MRGWGAAVGSAVRGAIRRAGCEGPGSPAEGLGSGCGGLGSGCEGRDPKGRL